MGCTVLVLGRWILLLTKLVPMPVGMAWRGLGVWGRGFWGFEGYPVEVSCAAAKLLIYLLQASRRHRGKEGRSSKMDEIDG